MAQVLGRAAAASPGSSTHPTTSPPTRKGNIYVADRGNRRIQVFDRDGKFLREITIDVPVAPTRNRRSATMPDVAKLEAAGRHMAPGAPWAVCITPGPNQVLYSSDAYPGRIYKLSLEGKVLGVLGKSGKQLKQFGWIHEIACPSENLLYVGELLELEGAKTYLHPSSLLLAEAMDAQRGWPVSVNPKRISLRHRSENRCRPRRRLRSDCGAVRIRSPVALEDEAFSRSGALSRRESINALA